MLRDWVSAAVARIASQVNGVVALKDCAPHWRGLLRAMLSSASSFCPSACESPKRALNKGRARTMRHSRSWRLTPTSTNCGSSTIWQKLSWIAFMAEGASRGPFRLIACTFFIG
ncbi:hypothetical protein D3C81_1723470 [compost metagenome]